MPGWARYALTLAASLAFVTSTLAITVDTTSCNPDQDEFNSAFAEAVLLAQTASKIISQSSAPESPSWWLGRNLFGGNGTDTTARLATIKSYYDAISTSMDVNIFCGDAFVTQEPDGTWLDTRTNGTVTGFQPCSSNGNMAYSLNGDIVVCSAAWTYIVQKQIGPDLAPYINVLPNRALLDDVFTLSNLILHSLLLIAETSVTDSANAQGFIGAYNLGQTAQNGDENPAATKNADSLVLFATAAFFHSRNIDFSLGYAEIPSAAS